MTASRSLILAILIALAIQSPAQSAQSDEQNVVRGTVVNAVTQAPIPRALVFSPDERYATMTDGEGHFEFTLPKTNPTEQANSMYAGSFERLEARRSANSTMWLMARKPGFLEERNGSRQIPGSPGTEVTIPLEPEALIKGRVTSSTSDAAVGVNVQLFTRQVQDGLPRWMPQIAARTNSAGEFRFSELPAGSFKVMTQEWMDNDPVATIPGGPVYGFPPIYYPGAAEFSAASTIELTAGQTVQADLALSSQQYYPVRIPVANGDINAGMNVSVRGQRGPGYSLGYNQREQRIEGSLPNGTYVVEANTYGPSPSTGIVNLRVNGAPADGPAMALSPNGSIVINVKEEFNEKWNGSSSWSDGKHVYTLRGPRAYLNVRVESAEDIEQPRGGSLRPPTGPEDELMVLENLSPGRYWLRVNSSRGYAASATLGATDLLREPFSVGSGARIPIEIKMRDDSANLDGSVTGLAGRPMPGGGSGPQQVEAQAWIYCVPLSDSSGQFQLLQVSDDGKFNVTTMVPGGYRLLAFPTQQNNLAYRDPEAMRAYESKGPAIHLAAGQKTTVQVPLISGSE